jgi:hypothetical protein
LNFQRKSLRVQRASVNDYFDSLFCNDIDGLLDALPGCFLVAGVRSGSPGLGVVGEIDLYSIRISRIKQGLSIHTREIVTGNKIDVS